jgi:hypothetical protein
LTFDGILVPSEVGVVFTDGYQGGANITFEGWSEAGATGTLLASVTAFRGDDGTSYQNFGDNCFFGIKDVGEIRSIRLWYGLHEGGIELDMLRVYPIPEPATISLLALGSLAVMRRKCR